MMLKYYDPSIDEYRDATQEDIDILVKVAMCFGETIAILRKITDRPAILDRAEYAKMLRRMLDA